MKLRFRAAAVRDLDGIYDYSTAEHGTAVADAYLQDLEAGMERLLDFPELGAMHDAGHAIRALSVRQHIIFYGAAAEAITIVRVLHKSMDADRHLTN